jgi:hypothetical protein
VPGPELPEDTVDWLFDSTRDYFTQLAAYKNRLATKNETNGTEPEEIEKRNHYAWYSMGADPG